MGKPTGFMEFDRDHYPERSIEERIHDYKEIHLDFPVDRLRKQGARCMDCGIPFCNQGCPLGNLIPEWNDLIYKQHWKEAIERLHATNNFPEFTGTLCPAPCEASCVLGINEKPVTIKYIEFNIIDHAFQEGWVKAQAPQKLTGKKVAVIGSGPAGLACAQQLRRAGHEVVVFERDDRIGGLLRYGIPDFKMQKERIDFRLKQMEEEGVQFKPNTNIGVDLSFEQIRKEYDAMALCVGAGEARDLNVPGRELKGVYLAMEYLCQQNKVVAGDQKESKINAQGKKVIILGGGDTGADCLGTAVRQGASQIHQFELLPKPPLERNLNNPWPEWPWVFRTSPAHAEAIQLYGGEIRDYCILTQKLSGEKGQLKKLHAMKLEWKEGSFKEIPGSEFVIEVDLLLLAMGFTGPEKNPFKSLGLKLDARGNIEVASNFMSSEKGIFAAGDSHRGASLIVWAIAEGRKCAKGIDTYLMGSSELP